MIDINVKLLMDNLSTFKIKENIDKLIEWYKLSVVNTKWTYVVYASRMTYCIANMMEDYTGIKMKASSNQWFFTNVSFLNMTTTIADYYVENARFPSILICDVGIVHGKSITNLLFSLEKEVIPYITQKLDNITEQDIRKDLSKAITIHVFAKVAQQTLIPAWYSYCIKSIKVVDIHQFHQIYNDLSMLASFCSKGINTLIPCRYISLNEFETAQQNCNLIKTSYHGTSQYTKIKLIYNKSNQVTACIALCYTPFIHSNATRMIPFVFIPYLDENMYKLLLDKLVLIIRSKNYEYVDIDLFDGYLSGSNCTTAEWVTLILSLAVTGNINYSISDDELLCISRNYVTYFLDNNDIYNILKEIVNNLPLKKLL